MVDITRIITTGDTKVAKVISQENTFVQVIDNGNTTKVTKLVSGEDTIVKKVVVGRPIRRIKAAEGTFESLSGLDTSNKTNGSVLVYDGDREVFVATLLLENQIVNGGSY